VCVCVCVCVRERERERERNYKKAMRTSVSARLQDINIVLITEEINSANIGSLLFLFSRLTTAIALDSNKYKQDRQSTYNVPLRRVRKLLLPWKSSKNYIFCLCMCVCVGRGACACTCVRVVLPIQHAARMTML
jgi:hypothetical protein